MNRSGKYLPLPTTVEGVVIRPRGSLIVEEPSARGKDFKVVEITNSGNRGTIWAFFPSREDAESYRRRLGAIRDGDNGDLVTQGVCKGSPCLKVAGSVVAVVGDRCRDPRFPKVWTQETILEILADVDSWMEQVW